MLGLLDLRERGERLEPSRFESDPTVTETVRGILQRVRVEGDAVLVELAQRFDGADLSTTGLIVTRRRARSTPSRETPAELRAALDALIGRLQDLHRRQLPAGVVGRARRGALRRGRRPARRRRLLRTRGAAPSIPRRSA